MKNIAIASFVLLVAFALWRNYGVIPKGEALDISNPKTNEQRELSDLVKDKISKEGDEVRTSFGYYEFKDNKWIKTKEVWE